MNSQSQIIEKLITANNHPCPEFVFENPLLDSNVAKAVSKSFIKIINSTEPDSKVNNTLRLSTLEKLRRLCRVEPENHMKIDDTLTSVLVEAYEQQGSSNSNDESGKILDEYLIRSMKDMEISTSHNKSFSPEVLQALINLKENRGDVRIINEIIHWDIKDEKLGHILKQLWLNGNDKEDEISLKLKAEIEKILLYICRTLLNDLNCNIPDLFVSNTDLKLIVMKSAVSSMCFQMSCSILNYLFVMTKYASRMQIFIKTFIEKVKENFTELTFSVLYPMHLRHIVVLLDIELQKLPLPIKTKYAENAIIYMQELKDKSQTDFLMLLSHFPQWFDIIPQ